MISTILIIGGGQAGAQAATPCAARVLTAVWC